MSPTATEPSVAEVAAAVASAAESLGEDVRAAVAVPATTANLGPGYDALGAALDVPLVAVAGPPAEQRVTTVGFGAGELPTGEDNLVWRALLTWCERVGASPPDVSLTVHTAIPLERGMGSSSAAAVAGLVLGRALIGGSGGDDAILRLATELEGHPDNAAPALVGGLTLCPPDGGVRRVAPSEGLRPVLLVPRSRQSTRQARAALPATVPLTEAAANAARATETFAGLAGLLPLRASAMTDVLHEPARLALMPTAGDLVTALRGADVPAALSGAGPAVLAVLPAADAAALAAVERAAAACREAVEVLPTRWNLAGATLLAPG